MIIFICLKVTHFASSFFLFSFLCCSDLRSRVSELELRLHAQEKEMKNQINKFSEIQSQFEMAKKELAEKDKLLSKSRDELTKTTGQYEQSVSKVMYPRSA